MKRTVFLASVVAAWLSGNARPALAGPYVAFSLREAAVQAQQDPARGALGDLGGMTRVCGMVYDGEGNDLILVGRVVQGQASASLDDLVVALRARMLRHQWPTVSIDPTPATGRTGLQAVTFLGGIENSAFGRDLLQADIILKECSLQLRPLVAPVVSYRALYGKNLLDSLRRTGVEPVDAEVEWFDPVQQPAAFAPLQDRPIKDERAHRCRFWFHPCEPPYFLARDGVFCIQELRLMVREELVPPSADAAPASPPSPEAADAARQFAAAWGEHLGPLSAAHPVLKRLKILYDLVAVAEGVRELGCPGALKYLLEDHVVAAAATAEQHRLVRLCALVKRTDGLQHAIELSGGVQLKADLRWLKLGEVGRLRNVVLKTRPAPRALTWGLPLEEWKMPNAQDLDAAVLAGAGAGPALPAATGDAGCSVATRAYLVDPSSRLPADSPRAFRGFGQPASALSPFNPTTPRWNVNGVLIDPTVIKDAETLRWDGIPQPLAPFVPGGRPVQPSHVPVQNIEDEEFQQRQKGN